MTNTAYIAGPMTNLTDFNFPAFDAVAAHARTLGFEDVSNPHEHDQELYPGIDAAEATKAGDVQALADEIGFSFEGAMSWDLVEVIRTNHIILLPGWENSTGARFERAVAEATGSQIILATQRDKADGTDERIWQLTPDEDQQRMTDFLRTFAVISDFGTHAEAYQRGWDAGYEGAKKSADLLAEPSTPAQLPLHEAITELQGRLKHVPGAFHQLEQVRAQLA